MKLRRPFSTRAAFAGFALLAASLVLSGCTRLGVFNAVVPHDGEAQQVGTDIAFGTHPRLKLDIYAAPQAANAPVVVFIYGGSWNSGRRQDYAFAGHALAAKGFVTVIPDYRLVPEVAYPEFLDDNARAVKWTVENIARWGGDPQTLFLAGHSAGAYNAVMLGADPALLAAHGLTPASIAGIAGLAGPYDFLPLRSRATRRAFGGAEDLEATQPVNRISSKSPPLFLAAGADDGLVLPRNSINLSERAQDLGVPVTFKSYPGIGHAALLLAISKPLRDEAPVLEDMAAFFSEYAASRQ